MTITGAPRGRTSIPRRFDFDVPEALDHRAGRNTLRACAGASIDRPVYSFRIHAPLKRHVRVAAAEVVDRRGCMCCTIPPCARALDFSLFLDVEGDIRFIRRLLPTPVSAAGGEERDRPVSGHREASSRPLRPAEPGDGEPDPGPMRP